MSEQLFLEAFNSEPYFFEKEEKYGAMDIIYTFEDEAGHGFKFHFEKKVALGKHAYVCVLSQRTPGLKTYKRVIGKFSNPMRTVATLLAVVRDIHDTRKDVHGIVMSIPEQAFGSYSRLVKKIMTRELRTVLNVEDGEYTPEDFEKMGLVGIVTTVKPRNMNTVYTGPALKDYQERQAGISAPAAVVPGAKVSNVILSAKASINKTGAKIVFGAGSLVQGFDNSDLKAAAQNIASKYQSVTPFVETSGVGFTSKNVLDALKAANELSSVAEGNGYQIKVTAEGALSSIGFKLSELKVKFSLTGLDASNAKLTYTENGESVKLLALSLGWSAIGGNGSYSLMSYNGDIEQLRSSLKEYGTELNKPDGPVEDQNVHRKLEVNILRTNVENSVRFEIVNRFSRAEMHDGEELIVKLHSIILSTLAKLMQVVPGFIMHQVILGESGEVELRFESKYLPKILELIKKTVGNKARFVGLECLEDLVPKQPVVDPVAEKEPFYFDYDHRQITLTFDNAETAGRIKDQLLELGAATFNGNEFFTDKEKLILLDDKSLDVKKVQATLFPILGQPVSMNGVFVDPNVTTSVRSPDGVTYKIKGNTIQVEDAPKDSAMSIARVLIPMADRIFDDKGSNTLELNDQGIADGFAIHNIAPIFKKSNVSSRLSAKLFRSWESAVTEASNKYDLSTGDLGSSFTNNSSYLIDAATSGVEGEYIRTAGNVISGIVLKSNYKIREAVAKPLVALGFTVEYDVQGWKTQVKLPVNSDYTIPGTSELAVFIKEVDNLANIARNRQIVEYVGGNKNFKARWNPDGSRAFLILPTAESSGLGWRDYTAYATAPEYVRVDNIGSYEEFLKLAEFAKNFDFGANLLRNIGVSKYLSDVRSGGATASKSYKLKDGGEVEISFKFGDKVTIIFNQNSEGFDKEMSEFVSEKMEISGRASAIHLYMLGTADANKTLKNIDAWLDAHIVSKEDNSSKGNAKSTEALIDQEIESKKSWAEDILRESLSHNTSGHTVGKVEFVGTTRPTKDHVLYIFKLMVHPKFGTPVAQKAFVKGTIGLDVVTGYSGTGQNRQPTIKPVSITLDRSVTSWVGFDYDPKVADQYEKDMTFASNTAAKPEKVKQSGTLEIVTSLASSNDNHYIIVQDGSLTTKSAYGSPRTEGFWRFAPKGMTTSDAEEFVKAEILKLYNSGASNLTIKAKVNEWLKPKNGYVIDVRGDRSNRGVKDIKKNLISTLEKLKTEGETKKLTGVDLRAGITRAYNGQTGRVEKLYSVEGQAEQISELYAQLSSAIAFSGMKGKFEVEFWNPSAKGSTKHKVSFTEGGAVIPSSMLSAMGNYVRVTQSGINLSVAKDFDTSPEGVVNEFMSYVGISNWHYNIKKTDIKQAIYLTFDINAIKAIGSVEVSSLNESTQIDEGIKEDLTGKAPNRIKRELLEATLKKLGLYRESFTYGNATFKTVMTECAVEIVPTSGNIRNFAKMLGARLGQELRIDDEGFLSFDLDNI